MVHSILFRSAFVVSWESSLNRGHTNCLFCLQGSYRFLDVKLTTFPRLFFPKQWFLFPDSRFSNRWSIETLKNRNKAFFMSFHGALQKWTIFQNLSLYCRLYPGLENCWAKTFLRIQDSVRTKCYWKRGRGGGGNWNLCNWCILLQSLWN